MPRPGACKSGLNCLLTSVVLVGIGHGQTLLPEFRSEDTWRLRPTDLVVLEGQEPRQDLRCSVLQVKPVLSWDFNFLTGYRVGIPQGELVGTSNRLTVLFRVVPKDRPREAVYMTQSIDVPAIAAGKGEWGFSGNFIVGSGKYHVDWLMRDEQQRVCAAFWDVEPKVNSKDVQFREWISRSMVGPVEPLFAEAPPVIRERDRPLPQISIIVSFDPPHPSSVRLDDRDIESLVAILRRTESDPRLETGSIIVCSLEAQQILYQQKGESRLSIPALGEALKSLKLGQIDAKRLSSSNNPGQFATDLIREHMRTERPDALVVIARKATGESPGVSRSTLESLQSSSIPAFYLSYDAGRPPSFSRDLLSSIMKRLRGIEYRIGQPKDLFNAWSEVVSRIVHTKQGAQASVAGRPLTP